MLIVVVSLALEAGPVTLEATEDSLSPNVNFMREAAKKNY